MTISPRRSLLALVIVVFNIQLAFAQTTAVRLPARFPLGENPVVMTRGARPAVYFDAVGRKAGILGKESGEFESWVFPMKLFHGARMSILVKGQDNAIDFASIVTSVEARPEGTTLIGSDQLFTIRATWFSPIDEPGSILLLDVDTTRPLTVTMSFVPDLKPMWPGGLGGQSAGWREDLKAFVISESRRKFNGLFGSPAATKGVATPAHQLASGALRFDLRIDPKVARQSYYPIIIAGGINGRQPVIDAYQRLAGTVAERYQKTSEHYRRLREELTSIETPDRQFNLAFEWAKIALDRGMVDHPELGLGLVAGWGASGDGARPGFGWFFGGDAAINSYAITGYGDFESVRAAMKFLAKYQRADGKIPHEISQSAAMIKWFEEYPYAYYHADTTPFFIAAVANLYRQTGDRTVVEELWPALKKAYEFCLSNDSDGDGILENSLAGLGASELGSLLNDLHQDIYLAATNLEASLGMREMAGAMGETTLRALANQKAAAAFRSLNEFYWDQKTGRYVYALGKNNRQNPEITAWTAAPMMFRQLDEKRVGETLATLSSSEISTDWGVRMISNRSAAYDPVAYNNGGVWPFLTGFVACGEYEYRRAHAGFAHLRQLVNLGADHALGLHPEILSGDYYRPLDESVPHQLFSSSMVVTPLIRGMLGLRADAANHMLTLAPQLPASWDAFTLRNYRVGPSRLTFSLRRTGLAVYKFDFEKNDDELLKLLFLPPLPALSKILKVTIDGKPPKPSLAACAPAAASAPLSPAPACALEIALRRRASIEITLKGGLEVDLPATPVAPGSRTSALKILEAIPAAGNRYTLRLEGLAGRSYLLRARAGAPLLDVSNGTLKGEENGWRLIEVRFPPSDSPQPYQRRDLEIRLKEPGKK